MTHVNFLLHRLLLRETHTDRQDKFVIDIYIYIYKGMFIKYDRNRAKSGHWTLTLKKTFKK